MTDRHEPLLRQVERWSPAEGEIWSRWRQTLARDARSDVLALEAVLAGLVAVCRGGRSLGLTPAQVRAQLEQAVAACRWAIDLSTRLLGARPRQTRQAGFRPTEPEASLHRLRHSLGGALDWNDRALRSAVLEPESFRANADLLLYELQQNRFFGPPEPLEFCNATELVSSNSLTTKLASWQSEAARTIVLLSLLSLVRSYRFLGIADRQIGGVDGLARVQVVMAGVRRELRMWRAFMLRQGIGSFADERQVALRAVVDDLHAARLTLIHDPLPVDHRAEGPAQDVAAAERARNTIRTARTALKEAARDLHRFSAEPERTARHSERVARDLRQDVWGFRFILRAFVAKASSVSGRGNGDEDGATSDFISEFVRHFRVFGPRLARATEYPRRAALVRRVGALSRMQAVEGAVLSSASEECVRFADYLESLLEKSASPGAPFDKHAAAAALRRYLASAKVRSSADRAAAAAFGLSDSARRLQAG